MTWDMTNMPVQSSLVNAIPFQRRWRQKREICAWANGPCACCMSAPWTDGFHVSQAITRCHVHTAFLRCLSCFGVELLVQIILLHELWTPNVGGWHASWMCSSGMHLETRTLTASLACVESAPCGLAAVSWLVDLTPGATSRLGYTWPPSLLTLCLDSGQNFSPFPAAFPCWKH